MTDVYLSAKVERNRSLSESVVSSFSTRHIALEVHPRVPTSFLLLLFASIFLLRRLCSSTPFEVKSSWICAPHILGLEISLELHIKPRILLLLILLLVGLRFLAPPFKARLLLVEVLEFVLRLVSLHLVDHLKPPALTHCASPGRVLLFLVLLSLRILRSAHLLRVVVLPVILPSLHASFPTLLMILLRLLHGILVPVLLLVVLILVLWVLFFHLLHLFPSMFLRLLFVVLLSWRRRFLPRLHLKLKLLVLLLWLAVVLAIPVFVIVVPLHLVI